MPCAFYEVAFVSIDIIVATCLEKDSEAGIGGGAFLNPEA
jgi:hypothetical protein